MLASKRRSSSEILTLVSTTAHRFSFYHNILISPPVLLFICDFPESKAKYTLLLTQTQISELYSWQLTPWTKNATPAANLYLWGLLLVCLLPSWQLYIPRVTQCKHLCTWGLTYYKRVCYLTERDFNDTQIQFCFLLCGWYWSLSPSSPEYRLWPFCGEGVVLKSLKVLSTSCGCTQNPWRVLPLLFKGAFFVFSSHDIGPSLKWHCCLHLQLFCIPVEPVHCFLSLVAVEVVLMSGERRGNAEAPEWLFMNSSLKTKSIRLGMPSHGYWLPVSGS